MLVYLCIDLPILRFVTVAVALAPGMFAAITLSAPLL